MKRIAFILFLFLTIACKKESQEPFGKQEESTTNTEYSEGMPATTQTPEQLGESIYNGKGTCVSCHKADEKSIGPSLKEIAKIYKEKNASLVAFLKGESDAIVDPSQFAVMQANLALTKTLTDEELQGIEAYINSKQ
jgi:cytochrome c